MILLCGIPSETPLALVRQALDNTGTSYRVVNQRRFATTGMWYEVDAHGTRGCLELDGERIALEAVSGVYLRLMDPLRLPELDGCGDGDPTRRHCLALQEILQDWAGISGARVVNRPAATASNASKPYQAQLIQQHGFAIPETLITTDTAAVLEFRARHGRLIYKSISGVRSIVQLLDETDMERLAAIRWCPTQFQEYVEGTEVRVHVVDKQVFATEVSSSAVDYRYAVQQVGASPQLSASILPDSVAERCVALAHDLGLSFAGIDLKFASDGRVFCFEANPSPAYSYFELNSGQPIAAAVASYLGA